MVDHLTMETFKTGFFKLRKFDLLKNRVLIGIDYGCSLIKIVFLNKKHQNQLFNDECTHVTFQYVIFNKENFEIKLDWIKEHAYISEGEALTIHGTGVGCFTYKNKIESLFGYKLQFVNEGVSIVGGHKIALDQIPIEYLIRQPVIDDDLEKLENQMKIDYVKTNQENQCDSSVFPFLLYQCNSTSMFYYFDDNGIGQQVGYLQTGGKTFLGLAKCVLDTNNYDEITSFASKGDITNLYSNVKRFHDNKTIKLDKGFEYFSKDDLARSLIFYESEKIISNCINVCQALKLKKIYLSGNTFISKCFEEQIQEINKALSTDLKFINLNLGYVTAIGAMFCSDEDTGKYMKL